MLSKVLSDNKPQDQARLEDEYRRMAFERSREFMELYQRKFHTKNKILLHFAKKKGMSESFCSILEHRIDEFMSIGNLAHTLMALFRGNTKEFEFHNDMIHLSPSYHRMFDRFANYVYNQVTRFFGDSEAVFRMLDNKYKHKRFQLMRQMESRLLGMEPGTAEFEKEVKRFQSMIDDLGRSYMREIEKLKQKRA